MSDLLQAVVLGVVQGLTEFIPVSSSAHLVLVPYLAGWERPGLAFDVALHVGTLLAATVYFRRELIAMFGGLFGFDRTLRGRTYRRLGLLIVAANVPVAIAGFTLEGFFEEVFATPVVVPVFLLVTAAILVAGERWRDRRIAGIASTGAAAEPNEVARTAQPAAGGRLARGSSSGEVHFEAREHGSLQLPTGVDREDPLGLDLGRVGLRQALVIGVAQMFALLPGVSRSGSTIVAGMFSGLTREAATRFSFLLGLPAMVGAGVLSLPELSDTGSYAAIDIAGGVIAAFLSGYLAIRFLLVLISRYKLTWFACYCAVAAAVGTIGYLMIGSPNSG